MSIDNKLLDIYIKEYFKALDCPRALTCYLLFTYGEHEQLCNLDFEPAFYADTVHAQDSLAATKFLSKATFLNTGLNLRDVALQKFFSCETACGEANDRIRNNRFSEWRTCAALENAKRIISSILKGFPIEDFIDSCNWGPGATVMIQHRNATSPNKFDVERQITTEAYLFTKDWFHVAYPNWDINYFEIQNSSKLVTVPKNAKTDRVIAIEPGINLWFQKGIGKVIRGKLKAFGIDLNSQGHNQEKARLGSKFNKLATIDFSSASDTISLEVVKTLVPERWLKVMMAFRSNSTLVDGNILNFKKFSSMGNGFTFELETLIFLSLAIACCEMLDIDSSEISVYGDDVIIPSSAVDLYTSVCADVGFTVNKSKSYSSGYYRESCGEHFWRGSRIKPIFLKEPFNGKASLLKAANSLRRSAHSRNSYGCDRRLRRSWQVLVDGLGRNPDFISEGYGDCGLIENFEESATNVTRAKHGIEGYFVRVIATMSIKRKYDSPGLFLSKVKAIECLPYISDYLSQDIMEPVSDGNLIPLPGRSHYARKRLLIPQWFNLGPWV